MTDENKNRLYLLETDLGKRYWRYNDSDSDESRSHDLVTKLNYEQIIRQSNIEYDDEIDLDTTLSSIGDAWRAAENYYLMGSMGGDPIVEGFQTKEDVEQALQDYENNKHDTGFTGNWYSVKEVFENSDLLWNLISL